jgi:hypothetical protein
MKMKTQSENIQDLQRRLKKGSVFFTILYSILFVPFLGYAYLSPFVFHSPSATAIRSFAFVFLAWLLPLSIPVSIFRMWANYNNGRYRRIRIFWALPILAVLAFVFIDILLDFFSSYL